MWLALLLLVLIAASGFVLTYTFADEMPFSARAGAGVVIGQMIFALVGFVICCIAGFSTQTIFASAAVAALPLLLLRLPKNRKKLLDDVSAFRHLISSFAFSPNVKGLGLVFIYGGLLIFLAFFFQRAMLDLNGAIGTGSAHNVGDLSFHLQAIYGFLDGQNFPPQNPSFAGAKFTYPFMADLVTAMLAGAGAPISDAMFWQNIFLVSALIVLVRHFTLKLTNNSLAAEIAPLILLFSGGFGFVLFFREAAASGRGIFEFLMNLPLDYTIRPDSTWRWGNSLTTLFMTQRSLLFGMPLALIILTKLFQIFSFDDPNRKLEIEEAQANKKAALSEQSFSKTQFYLQCAVIGLLAGALPLVHAHSFAVVMSMAACLGLMSLKRWREWTIFFAAAALFAVPELLWAILGSATKAQSFIDWEFGWDRKGIDPIWFWLKNTGLFIPLLVAAITLLALKSGERKVKSGKKQNTQLSTFNSQLSTPNFPLSLLLFWLPFSLCFIVPNVLRLAPWIWDNIKVLIYWYVASVPLVAWVLAEIWRRGTIGKPLALGLLIALTLSGWLDVWRIASAPRQMDYTVFNRETVAFANQIRQKTAPQSVIASAPVYNSPAALTGRRWFLGYTGHVWSHGINPSERETILQMIYSGDEKVFEKLIRENNIDYLVVSPLEKDTIFVNTEFLNRFPVVVQTKNYQLLKVR